MQVLEAGSEAGLVGRSLGCKMSQTQCCPWRVQGVGLLVYNLNPIENNRTSPGLRFMLTMQGIGFMDLGSRIWGFRFGLLGKRVTFRHG